MNPETQIAEKSIKTEKEYKGFVTDTVCKIHKASCQRFLEFLEDYPVDSVIEKKIQDLKQAIKLYDDAGI